MSIFICGAGGLAREVFAVLESAGDTVTGFCVEPGYTTGILRGLPVRDHFARDEPDPCFVIAIGDGRTRARLAAQLADARWTTALHQAAVLGPNVLLGDGVMVLGPCSATTDVAIGSHALINPGCTIAHDCTIGAFVSLGPAVSLAGGVIIEEGASLGIGAKVAPGCRIGAWAVVGAGAVVIRDVAAGDTVVGVPARSHRPDRS
ncbi:NeuD/PglB/VioB family sugar acetyltransferase [Bosea sp. PAMC 26642]|uniref:NeuD/PglB/VioB family sugar acetyltransferase n=1 Tax=Bosea sp. (strain PAMC 26642) TaxID=1792307 RepID=UPI0007701B8B|nr:NeuD/PglB/VioB family sugar acetyltransferase [Bosea sp. PAMC 26642]AMJ62691.1 hypothetical protein AXW83_22465 [Bosea sp. PAMC 26642]